MKTYNIVKEIKTLIIEIYGPRIHVETSKSYKLWEKVNELSEKNNLRELNKIKRDLESQ